MQQVSLIIPPDDDWRSVSHRQGGKFVISRNTLSLAFRLELDSGQSVEVCLDRMQAKRLAAYLTVMSDH